MPPVDRLFKDIADIPWRKLEGAYGPATVIPDLLYDLRYGTLSEAQVALEALGEIMFHQRTHYALTPMVIPWIIRLVEDPMTPQRDRLLYLLADIADMPTPPAASVDAQSLASIQQGMPVFQALAQHEDADICRAATTLIDTLTRDGRGRR